MTRRILIEDLVEFRKKQKHGDLRSYLINHPNSRFVNNGGYRHVYESVGDSEDYVIKWNRNFENYANEEDARHFSSGSALFPRLIAASDNFEWIAVEKVKLLDDIQFFETVIKKLFPSFAKIPGFLKTNNFKYVNEKMHNNFTSTERSLIVSSFLGMIGNSEPFSNYQHELFSDKSLEIFALSIIGFNPHMFKEFYSKPEKYFYNGFQHFYQEVLKDKKVKVAIVSLYKYLFNSVEFQSYMNLINQFKLTLNEADSLYFLDEISPSNLGYIEEKQRIVIIDSQITF